MIWSLFGLILGLILGLLFNIQIPPEYTRFSAVIIVGIADSLLGAIRAEVTHDQYNSIIFISGLFFNIFFAVGITYLGEHLGLNLYLAVTVVFMFRIFQNVGITRRVLIEKWLSRNKEPLPEN